MSVLQTAWRRRARLSSKPAGGNLEGTVPHAVSVLYNISVNIDELATLFLKGSTVQMAIYAGGTSPGVTLKITTTTDGVSGPQAVKSFIPNWGTGVVLPGATYTSNVFDFGIPLPTPDNYPDVTFDLQIITNRDSIVKTDPSAANGQTLSIVYRDLPPGPYMTQIDLTAQYMTP